MQYLNDKISKIRVDFKALKKENTNLKDSNENHIFINEKLNQALKKSASRIEELERKLDERDGKSETPKKNTLVVLDSQTSSQPEEKGEMAAENDEGATQSTIKQRINVMSGEQMMALVNESSFGDVSSIMIMPDQMYNNFNLLDDDEANQTQHKER